MVNKRHAPLWWAVVPLLLLAFGIALVTINDYPYMGDERHSVNNMGARSTAPYDLVALTRIVAEREAVHPPTHHLLLGAWGRLAGWDPLATRLQAVGFGLVALALTYRIGRDWLSGMAGLVAVALLGTTALFTYHMVHIRMYTQLLAVTLLALWAYLHIINARREPGRGWYAVYFVGAVGTLYTMYFATLMLAGIGLLHLALIVWPRGLLAADMAGHTPTDTREMTATVMRRWWRVTGLTALAGLTFLPWLLVVTLPRGMQDAVDRIEPLPLHAMLLSAADVFGSGYLTLTGVGLVLVLVALMTRGRVVRQLVVIALGILIAGSLVSEIVEVMRVRIRYLFSLWPVLALLIGAGIAWSGRCRRRGGGYDSGHAGACPYRWMVALGLTLLFVVPGATQSLDHWWRKTQRGVDYTFPIHRVADRIDGYYQTNDLMLHHLPDDGTARTDYDYLTHLTYPPDSYYMLRTGESPDRWDDRGEDAVDLIGNRERFWLIYAPERPPAALADFQARLPPQYQRCCTLYDRPELRIDLYTRLPLCAANFDRREPTLATWGESIHLTGFEQTVRDDRLSATLTWALDPTLPVYTYSVALQLLDEAGQLVAGADRGLDLPAFTCHEMTLDLSDVPPGTYRLGAVVYDWHSGARLPGRLADGGSGEWLPLAQVRVE